MGEKKSVDLQRYNDLVRNDRVLGTIIRAAIQARLVTSDKYLAIEYIVERLKEDFLITKHEEYDLLGLRQAFWNIYQEADEFVGLCGKELKILKPVAKKMKKENPEYRKFV